ncbi:MAG: Adaptive-response sensory-kinase SasA [Myxococcota bacterium]|nr:Adaptive-response sensory-kinase SasA [Myxococcota bacterium]
MPETPPPPPRRTIANRILLALIAVLLVFAAMTIYAAASTDAVREQLKLLQNTWIPLSRELAQVEISCRAYRTDLDKIISSSDPLLMRFHIEYFQNNLSAQRPQIAGRLRDAQDLLERAARGESSGGERRFQEEMKAQTQRVAAIFRQHEALVDSLFMEAQMRLLTDLEMRDRRRAIERTDRELANALRVLVTRLENRVAETVKLAGEKETALIAGLAVVSVLALGMGLLLAGWVRSMLAPLLRLIASARRISRGEYNTRVSTGMRPDDEVGQLAAEFDSMAAALREREQALGLERAKVERHSAELEKAVNALGELKRYNENIVNSIRLGIIASGPGLQITSFNPAAAELWAADQLAEDGALLSIAGLRDLAGVRERFEQVLETRSALVLEAVPVGEGESRKYVDILAVPLMGATGVQGLLLIAEDVTERVRTRERLMHSERLATIGRMAAQITHEVRNPLNSIGLNAEMLEEDLSKFPEEQRAPMIRLIRSIIGEIDRLSEVTEEYLKFARLPQPQVAPRDINSILMNLLFFLEQEAGSGGVTVIQKLAPNLPMADVDENQLRQALLNIIRNSIDAMKEGGVLTVETALVDHQIQISIADTGVGIAPDHLAHIFDPFYSTKEAGTGLGLSLTHQIITEHGGNIRAESGPGKGARFVIHLPARAARTQA